MDFSALKSLPLTTLTLEHISTRSAEHTIERINITNTGHSVAFFVHIRMLSKNGGSDILPVIFEDNYLLLAPGETRVINGTYLNKDAQAEPAFILVSAWNLDSGHSKAGDNAGFALEMQRN